MILLFHNYAFQKHFQKRIKIKGNGFFFCDLSTCTVYGAHGLVVMGVRPGTERSLVQTPIKQRLLCR